MLRYSHPPPPKKKKKKTGIDLPLISMQLTETTIFDYRSREILLPGYGSHGSSKELG